MADRQFAVISLFPLMLSTMSQRSNNMTRKGVLLEEIDASVVCAHDKPCLAWSTPHPLLPVCSPLVTYLISKHFAFSGVHLLCVRLGRPEQCCIWAEALCNLNQEGFLECNRSPKCPIDPMSNSIQHVDCGAVKSVASVVPPPPPLSKLRPCPSYSRSVGGDLLLNFPLFYGQATVGVGTVLIWYLILIRYQI